MIYLAPEIKIIFQFFKPESCPMPFMNKWVTAQCPARIDVSGGWSDTPPITYEHGGAVTMIGLQIRGKVWSTTFMYHMIMLICKFEVYTAANMYYQITHLKMYNI